MLSRVRIPGLLVTGTDTGIGKTLIAGAIARWFLEQGTRIAVCKPAGSGCVRRREGLVSEDAEYLALCADARHPLDLICPQRYLEPLAPAVAADRANQPLDWEQIQRALDLMSRDSEAMVVEGVGGLMVPMDGKHTFLDVAAWLGIPAVIVARPALGTINHTLLTAGALKQRGVKVAGVVINRYPAENATIAEETNARAIEKWGKVNVLCVVPDVKMPLRIPADRPVPEDVMIHIGRVDWAALAGVR